MIRYQYLFGPVNSRRLGMSLGVDLVPYKYCPLNCVYCEVQTNHSPCASAQHVLPRDEHHE
jgi:wyosine [tRNA(Phe)-imidazoG37] synthetase (radical SAM superfamily)